MSSYFRPCEESRKQFRSFSQARTEPDPQGCQGPGDVTSRDSGRDGFPVTTQVLESDGREPCNSERETRVKRVRDRRYVEEAIRTGTAGRAVHIHDGDVTEINQVPCIHWNVMGEGQFGRGGQHPAIGTDHGRDAFGISDFTDPSKTPGRRVHCRNPLLSVMTSGEPGENVVSESNSIVLVVSSKRE